MDTIIKTISTGDAALIALVFLSLVQISPIKINPWSWLAKKFGRAINGEVIKRITDLETRVESMQKCNERKRADEARNRILRYDDELRRKLKHSQEFWDQTLMDCDFYEEYCRNNKKYVNSKAGNAIKNIRETHEVVKQTNDYI